MGLYFFPVLWYHQSIMKKNVSGRKPGRKKPVAIIIVLAVILAFIWGQSLLNGDLSAAESGWFASRLRPIARAIYGTGGGAKVKDGTVRKLAHVAEYAALGFGLGFLPGKETRLLRRLLRCLLLGLIVAFLDETVQLFTGRSAQVTDMWIDLAGVLPGAFLSLLIRRCREKKTEGPESDRRHTPEERS